jgi:hypothetical protein
LQLNAKCKLWGEMAAMLQEKLSTLAAQVKQDAHAQMLRCEVQSIACPGGSYMCMNESRRFYVAVKWKTAAQSGAQPRYAQHGFFASQSLAALALTRPQPYWLSLPLGPRSNADFCSAALISALVQRGYADHTRPAAPAT